MTTPEPIHTFTICGPGHPDPLAEVHIHYERVCVNQPSLITPGAFRHTWRCTECGAEWDEESYYAAFAGMDADATSERQADGPAQEDRT